MANIHLNQLEMETYGTLPKVGTKAPEFILTQSDFMPIGLNDFKGKVIVLNVFPSIDTTVCFQSVKQIKDSFEGLCDDSIAYACVSMDLPYALQRSRDNNDLKNIQLLSDFRDHRFGADYGVLISSGPLTGLLARALFVIDEEKIVRYAEMSNDLNQSCQTRKVIKVLNQCC